MAKLRKMFGSAESPYILDLMKLIETQSNLTIANWYVNYVKNEIVPIYEKAYPKEESIKEAMRAYQEYINHEMKLPELKKMVAKVNTLAKEAEENPAAQAAARAIAQAIASIYRPTHSLGLAFYGAAAIAYERLGLKEKPEVYEAIAVEECKKMQKALQMVAISDEKNPAKIRWYC